MARRERSGGRLGVLRALNLLAFLPLAPRVPVYSKLLWSLVADERVPASRKALLAVAGAYVLSPIDFVPDWLPLLGGLDDVLVVVLAVEAFLEGLPASLIDEKLEELEIPRAELEEDMRRVRRAVPRSVRAIVARIPDAIDGLTTFIERSGVHGRISRLTQEGEPG
jgi:uncharacterized membrane protein YkvA (DUF1232 family)